MNDHTIAPSTSRRRMLAWSLGACAATTLPGCGSMPTSGATSREDERRIVERMTWGATDAELSRVRGIGLDVWIAQQLAPNGEAVLPPAAQAQIDALTIEKRAMPQLLADMEAMRKSADTLADEDARKTAQQAYQQELSRLARESATRHLLRALYSPQQLREQMTWFWFNHVNVHQYKANLRAMLGDYEAHALRPNALGRMRALLGAAIRHPAMLRYLDNDQNAAGRPNENLARELLELHTMGVDGGYSQRDVQELARVLTGHGVNLGDPPKLKREHTALYVRDGVYEFNPGRHDFGDKTLLGRTIKGRGAAELDEVLDLLAVHPSTARFVSRKIAQYLLADDPSPALVDAMARAFVRSDGGIADTLAVLVRAPQFAQALPGKFKDPMHYTVSAVRAAYGERVVLTTMPLQNWLNRLGEGLYNRQTPDGYPMTADAWSGSGQMATRFEIARAIGSSSAGLFKPDEATAQPAFPQLARPIYFELVRPAMREETRVALDNAGSQSDWNTLYLASPDFMYR